MFGPLWTHVKIIVLRKLLGSFGMSHACAGVSVGEEPLFPYVNVMLMLILPNYLYGSMRPKWCPFTEGHNVNSRSQKHLNSKSFIFFHLLSHFKSKIQQILNLPVLLYKF
jgi:hypothetical protein